MDFFFLEPKLKESPKPGTLCSHGEGQEYGQQSQTTCVHLKLLPGGRWGKTVSHPLTFLWPKQIA